MQKQCKTMQNNVALLFQKKRYFKKKKSKMNGTPSSDARALKPGDLVKITDCNFENASRTSATSSSRKTR